MDRKPLAGNFHMRRKLVLLFAFLALACSACAGNPSPGSQAPGPSLQAMTEIPTPYADTPSPAKIEAAQVEAPEIVKLDMFNELEGWAVTGAEIVRTNDGGVTWYNVSPPDMTATGYSIGAFFLDRDHAWIQKADMEKYPNSGTLYQTKDGGLTWKTYIVPFSEGDLAFVNAQDGWVMADLGVGAGSNAVAIFQTKDGGSSWEKTYTNDPNDAKASDSLPLGGIKSDLVPMDMNAAWVTGVTYAPGEVYLFRTNDQGKSWKQLTLPLPAGAKDFELGIDQDQMKLVSPTDGYLALRMSGSSIQTAVYVTHDTGNTWSLTPTVLDDAGASSFLTQQHAVIYNGSQFQTTRDGAQTWMVITPDIVFGETFVTMDFVNLTSGWVITIDPSSNHHSLYRTQDGGSTWLPVVP
jgi:photosystem II stability/assembly factor-like uncharacterized protein